MAKKGKYSNWAKSFGKSVKFGAKEILSELAPSMAETAGSMAEEVRELRQDLRALRSNKRQIVNYMLGEEENFSKYAGTALKNAKSSARTGKFYDPKREEKLLSKAMGLEDLDLDFDESSMDIDADISLDGDEESGGGESFSSVEMGPSKIVNMMGPSTKAMTAVYDGVTETTAAVNTGFANLNKSNKNNFALSESMHRKFHTEYMGQLQSISSNLVNIVQYNNETWSTYVKASMEFYDKNLELLSSINGAMLRLSPNPEEQADRTKKESPVDQFMSGGFSIKGYSGVVAQNMKKSFQNSMLGAALPMLNNDMLLSSIAANPLGFILKETLSAMLPDRFKKSLGNLDKAYRNFIPAALTKLRKYDGENTFIKALGSIFGISTDIDTKDFSQNDFERGAIPFDGETKAAVTRVIPGYLARQTAVLETIASRLLKGDDASLEENIANRLIAYNWDKGSRRGGMFMRERELEKLLEKEERRTVIDSYSDTVWDLQDAIESYAKDKGKVVNRKQDIEDFVYGLTHFDSEAEDFNDYKDLNQIKLALYKGTHRGKDPENEDYLKDPKLQEKAEALAFALSNISNETRLGMYGAEYHEARTNLSNFNTYYGSDAEHGAGRHASISQTKVGSIGKLFVDTAKANDVILSNKYRLVKKPNGKYAMSDEMLKQYNRDNSVNHLLTEFKTAEDVYNDMVANHPEYLSNAGQALAAKEQGTEAEVAVEKPKESYSQAMMKKYQIVKKDDGTFEISDEMRKQYNKDFGVNKRKASTIYEDILKREKESEAANAASQPKSSYVDEMMKKYQIVKKDDGTFDMPEAMLKQYNSDFGVNKHKASTVYEDILKREKAQTKAKGKKGKRVTAEDDDEVVDATKKTLTEKIKEVIQMPFNKLADLFDKVNQAMHDVIFGKKGIGTSLKEALLGKVNAKGVREGGVFSSAINYVKDTYTATKNYLFGDGNKKGILSDSVDGLKNMMERYFFGKPKTDSNGKEITVADRLKSMLVHGFGQLSSAFFGDNAKGGRARKKSMEQVNALFKKALPDIGKGAGLGAVVGTVSGLGGFGMLGSLFLPGGPIGGAIVGSAIGLLKQSRGFREMLFGKEVRDKNGNVVKRVGGLISSKVQNFFKSKKIAMGGGAVMGVGSTMMGHGIAFGLMPSIVVGAFGPVIAGAAWGLLSHSRAFRRVIFGTEIKNADGTVKKVGGLLNNRMMRKIKVGLPRAMAGALTGLGSMGVISQLGLVGNMIALGPIPAAIAGAGLGIATASKNFTKTMFGYTDKSGKYHSGALDKMRNFFTWEIFEPLKLKFTKEVFNAKFWVRRNVLAPLRKSFAPIREAVTDIMGTIRDTFSASLAPVKKGFENIFISIARSINRVFTPVFKVVKTMSQFMYNSFKKAVKASITAALLPLRAAGGLLRMMLEGKNYKSTVTDAIGGVFRSLQTGEGIGSAMSNLGNAVFRPKSRFEDDNKYEEKVKAAEKKAFTKGSSILEAQTAKMREMQEKIRKGNYDLTDDQIAEMRRNAEEDAKRDASIVDDAKKSEDTSVQLQRMSVEQTAQSNVILGKIEENTRKTKQALGVEADDDAAAVDEKNKEEKKEKEATEREEKKITIWTKLYNALTGKDKEEKKGGIFSSLLSGIGSIASGILGILSNIGTLGATALGIYGLIKMFFGNKDKGGESEALAHSTQMGTFAEYGAKKVSGFVSKHIEGFAKIGSNIGKGAMSIGKRIKNKVLQAGSHLPGTVGEKLAAMAEKGLKETSESEIKKGKSFFTKIKQALEWIGTSELGKKVFGDTSKLGKFIDIITDLAKRLMDPKIMSILSKMFPKQVANTAVRTGAAATGLGLVVNVGFGIYDGITGAIDADRLFDVNPEDVTITMRLVSSFINTFFGLPGVVGLDLLLSAASFGAVALGDTLFGKFMTAAGYDLRDFDHRKIFAQFIYNLITDEDTQKQTADKQKKFDDKYKAYLKEKGLKPENFSKEQYREAVGNKTVWQKYGAPIMDKVLGIGQGGTIKSFGERISGWMDDMTKWFKNAVDTITSFSPIDWFKEVIGLGKDWSMSAAFGRMRDRWNSWMPWDTEKPGTKPGSSDSKKNTGNTGLWNKAKGAASSAYNYFFGGDNGYYSQGNAKWMNQVFGEGTMKDVGCAPAVLANIARMNGVDVDPGEVAKMADVGVNANGASPKFLKYVADKIGLNHQDINSGEDMIRALQQNAPIAIGGSSSNPNSPFYGNGHYVVAKGMDSAGNVNILNPSGQGKLTSMPLKDLVNQSIANHGYAGTFVGGASGRMSVAEAQAAAKNNEPKLDMEFRSDPKRYESYSTEKKNDVMDKMDQFNSRNRKRNGEWTEEKGKIAKAYEKKETARRRAAANKKGAAGSPKKLGFMEIVAGFGLGLKNLFSSIVSGGKYENVSISDLFGGIGSKLFGGGSSSGGAPNDRGVLTEEPDDGQYWVRQTGNVKLKGCHVQVIEVLDTLGEWFYEQTGHKLVVTAGTNGQHAKGKYSHQQGWKVDVNDWYGPENLQGGYITEGASLTIPFKQFGHEQGLGMADEGDHIDVQFADGYDWQDGKYYGGWDSKHGGGGGSFDASEGHIDTKKAVWNYLVNDLEMNRAGAAGVMGNIEQESHFDTGAYNPDDVDGNPSGGLVQWHAGRFTNLKNYAASIGKDWSDVDSQVGYLGQELNGPYSHVYDDMRDAPTVNSAVDTWVRHFEIPADIPGEINRRTPMAQAYFDDHTNFVGGANGFGGFNRTSSANPLAGMIANGLFGMFNRYNERGREKKIQQLNKYMAAGVPESQIPASVLKYKQYVQSDAKTQAYIDQQAAKQGSIAKYAETYNQPDIPKPVNATMQNAAIGKILPAKVDTGGASMDDLLLSIRALDSHNELNQIIGYLATIAKNGGVGGGSRERTTSDKLSDINMKRIVEKAKANANTMSGRNQLALGRYNDANNVIKGMEGISGDVLQLAFEIAKGGDFRKS